jgi:dihydrofolate synthase/folylpolyglutamate synthase
LRATEVLAPQGFSISTGQMKQGISRARLKGRFDIVGREPLTILDGAHNPSAIRALMDSVRRLYGERKLTVVFSCLMAKDRRSMAKLIKRYAERVILTRIKSERAATLAALKRSFGMKTPAYPVLEDALLHAQREAGRNGLILVTGSIYLVAEAYLAIDKWG